MFELTNTLKVLISTFTGILLCHRAIYAGMALFHGWGCILADTPELYGPMAILYAILALKG